MGTLVAKHALRSIVPGIAQTCGWVTWIDMPPQNVMPVQESNLCITNKHGKNHRSVFSCWHFVVDYGETVVVVVLVLSALEVLKVHEEHR